MSRIIFQNLCLQITLNILVTHESFFEVLKPETYSEQIKKLNDELRKFDLKDSDLAVRECFNFSKKGRIKSFTGK